MHLYFNEHSIILVYTNINVPWYIIVPFISFNYPNDVIDNPPSLLPGVQQRRGERRALRVRGDRPEGRHGQPQEEDGGRRGPEQEECPGHPAGDQ